MRRPVDGRPARLTALVLRQAGRAERRFPPPWSVEKPDPKLERRCFIVRDANGQALAYVYFEEEPGVRGGQVASSATLTVRRSPLSTSTGATRGCASADLG